MKVLKIKTHIYEIAQKYQEKANYKEDSGFDLYCPYDLVIPANSYSNEVNLYIMCEMVDSGINVPYLLLPRSSTGSKTPLRLCNSMGLIDAGYRGMIKAFVDNISDKDYKITKGDRLFQIVAPGLDPISCEVVNELSGSERGVGGFGSTGR